MPEQLTPTPIIIDGAVSRMSRILVRAAAERDDITIAAVVGPITVDATGKQSSEQVFNWMLNHDSVYGRADLSVPYFTKPNELKGEIDDAVIVSFSTDAEQVARDFGDYGLLPEKLVVASMGWAARKSRERPVAFIKGSAHQPGTLDHPVFVPHTLFNVSLPLISQINTAVTDFWATEIRSTDEGDSLVDQANPRASSLSDTRSAATGILRHNLTSETEAALYGSEHRSHSLERWYRFNSYSVPSHVGSVTNIIISSPKDSSTFEGYKTAEEVLTLYPDIYETTDSEPISSIDIKKNPRAIVSPKGSVKSSQLEEISFYYDGPWFRANRILDAARYAAQKHGKGLL
jgi:hypothetical protein